MTINFNKMKKDVFYLKLKLSNVVCLVLTLSLVVVSLAILVAYHYVVYLRKTLPLWEIAAISAIVAIFTHFSFVALKSLLKGVRSH